MMNFNSRVFLVSHVINLPSTKTKPWRSRSGGAQICNSWYDTIDSNFPGLMSASM